MATLVEQLFTLSVPPVPSDAAARQHRELAAIARALD
jgi:hypothetical protein